MNIYIGRQPIYNDKYNIEGYELFYRQDAGSGAVTQYSGRDSTVCCILTDAFFGFRDGSLTNQTIPYVNLTRNLLLEGFADLYQPGAFMIEVPPNIFLDGKLGEQISLLHYKGHKISLKSYTPTIERTRNLKFFGMLDVVRLDFSRYNRLMIRESFKKLRRYHLQLLADNIETQEDLDFAHELGFDLFQGNFLETQSCLSRNVSLRDLPYGQLFNHLLTGRVNPSVCAQIISGDPVLMNMFLRKVFNCLHNRKAPLLEVERGLSKISDAELRHWTAVVLLDQACTNDSEKLVPLAFRRALLMEYLTAEVDLGVSSAKAFMFGIVSVLDRVLNEDMAAVAPQLELDDSMRATLVSNADNGYTLLLKAARAYEADPEAPAFPSVFSRLGKERISQILWKIQINTEYITLSLDYTVPSNLYKGNILIHR